MTTVTTINPVKPDIYIRDNTQFNERRGGKVTKQRVVASKKIND